MFERIAPMTVEQFEAFALQSDEKIMEFIGGETYLAPTNAYAMSRPARPCGLFTRSAKQR